MNDAGEAVEQGKGSGPVEKGHTSAFGFEPESRERSRNAVNSGDEDRASTVGGGAGES